MKDASDVEEGCGISVSAGSSGSPVGAAGSGAAEAAAGPDAAAPSAAAAEAAAGSGHYWEDDIFKGEEPGKVVRWAGFQGCVLLCCTALHRTASGIRRCCSYAPTPCLAVPSVGQPQLVLNSSSSGSS